MTLVHTHLRTRHQRQSSAQVGCSGCSHGVRARVWEAPGAGSTPDYSAHRQARPITVHAPCTVSRSFERGCTLLPCSICVSARIHHHQVKPGTPSSKTRLTIYSSDVWHCALSQAKNALNTTLCVCGLCPRSVRGGLR